MQPPKELNDIVDVIPNIILDIRYATENNFTGVRLYEHQVAWLRREALEKLALAAEELAAESYKIVVFDAFRPQSVQQKLRSVVHDENYVAAVSNHCKGITVDLTLADEYDVYLDMGTDYDDFTETAHSDDKHVTLEQSLNRQILRDAMLKYGFTEHPHEWWHFDYQPENDWPLIDDESNAVV